MQQNPRDDAIKTWAGVAKDILARSDTETVSESERRSLKKCLDAIEKLLEATPDVIQKRR